MAKFENVSQKVTTAKGTLTGFVALANPSTMYDKEGVYTAYLLVDKKEGERLVDLAIKIRTEQFKTYGKGSKVAAITKIKPYEIVNEETGEAIPDAEGRYLIKATRKARIKDGEPTRKVAVIDGYGKPMKGDKVAAGTIAREGLIIKGYTVAGSTGISVDLSAVQIINLVEYGSDGTAGFDFGIEVDGYDSTQGLSQPKEAAFEAFEEDEELDY